MKKIIPAIIVLGASAALVGSNCTNLETKPTSFSDNIEEFARKVDDYTKSATEQLSNTSFDKYSIRVSAPINELNGENGESKRNYGNGVLTPLSINNDMPLQEQTNITSDSNIEPETKSNENDLDSAPINDDVNITDSNENILNNIDIPNKTDNNEENLSTDIKNDNNSNDNTANETKNESISTLYSLSNDIDESCGEFCELKEKLTNAIIETQNLINKVNDDSIELTAEQRMFITEQSSQLKSLSRQLSRSTTELSLSLSDLNEMLKMRGDDYDALSFKYMVVLDNIVNGNEMLENGLNSLNMINHMFNMSRPLPPNNQGRILYGFQRNNEEPIIKDYLIDDNGEIKENQENTDENNTTTDTYAPRQLKSNIDTYQGNIPKNIDTFFNTALLDNEFMYGNGGYGYNGFMNGFNPYMNRNYMNNQNNNPNVNEQNNIDNSTQDSDNNSVDTQNNDNTNNTTNGVDKSNNTPHKQNKKFKLSKNVDTYRDENTPTPKMRFSNIKQSVSDFFSRFSKKA